jgi:predicted naringenin-chalcone synthase
VYEYPHNFLGSRTEYKYNHLEKHLWREVGKFVRSKENKLTIAEVKEFFPPTCARNFMRRVERTLCVLETEAMQSKEKLEDFAQVSTGSTVYIE